MNTLEQSSTDLTPDQHSSDEHPESIELSEHKISGYDGGTRAVLKEPSLYLSIAVIFIATAVCLSKTPTVFWLSFVSMSALAIIFHVLAERLLFRANREFDAFAAPLEGVFVLTFGAILPGIALLAYGVYSLSTAVQPNVLEEAGKLALLLVVPLFNFIVWSAVRKGYLIRPRLIGLMNGLALGLAISWTIIWMKSLFLSHGDPSCKFGWMLLMCTSPFLLFAAACLSFDLWRKTERSISRITTTFSILGTLLSMLFVFTPMVRAFFIQTLLTDAKQGSIAQQTRALPVLRSLSISEDLRPSKYPVNGFALAELLLPNRGLDAGSDADKDAYFKITGKPYLDAQEEKDVAETEQSPAVGAKVPGLSLSKSQISGSIDASTLSSSVDWTLTFHNSTWNACEALGEIALPKRAAVSRVTLWINGHPREAAFGSTAKTREAYQHIVSRQSDPLLVTMSAADRVLVQCFPVPANGGNMKIRIGFKVPLQTTDGKTCTLELPKLLSSNFAQPKRHRISLVSRDMPVKNIAGIETHKNANGYSLNGIIKTTSDRSKTISSVVVQRTTPLKEIAVPDWYSRDHRFIVQQLQEITTPAPKRLFVVLDLSGSLKSECSQIKEALSSIPSRLKPVVYLSAAQDAEKVEKSEISAKPIEQARIAITPDAFVGGQDNRPALREALETAAEASHSAVLWIHGPQPLAQDLSQSTALDLVHSVRLFDLQFGSGPNSILQALKIEDVSNLMSCESLRHESTSADLKALVSGWEKATKRLSVRRYASEKPQTPIVTDPSVSAQVTCLWANDEVQRLLANDQEKQAEELAARYRLVSQLTGAVVLENSKDYKSFQLDPGAFKDGASSAGGGLVGAPVDPRYGQSNEVGQLLDFGYDTARDISRMMTAMSTLISSFLAIVFLRSRKSVTGANLAKAAGLMLGVPTIVHLVGTFMINNYGGLGGGL